MSIVIVIGLLVFLGGSAIAGIYLLILVFNLMLKADNEKRTRRQARMLQRNDYLVVRNERLRLEAQARWEREQEERRKG